MVITAICGKHRWRGIEHCATTQFPTAEAIISFRIIDTKRGDVIKRATTRDPRFENRSRILPHGLKQRFIWIYQEESNDNYINENKYFLFWIFIFKKTFDGVQQNQCLLELKIPRNSHEMIVSFKNLILGILYDWY